MTVFARSSVRYDGWQVPTRPRIRLRPHTIAMSQARFTRRRRSLIARMRKLSLPALLVTDESNVTWLTGFTGDSSYLLVGPETGSIDQRHALHGPDFRGVFRAGCRDP